MIPKPLSPDEILEWLPRLAATDKQAACRIAMKHPDAKETWGYKTPEGTGGKWTVTIPRPPKHRALRRDELPEDGFEWREKSKHRFSGVGMRCEYSEKGFCKSDLEWRALGNSIKETERNPWNEFHIDEPQDPMVISTEDK